VGDILLRECHVHEEKGLSSDERSKEAVQSRREGKRGQARVRAKGSLPINNGLDMQVYSRFGRNHDCTEPISVCNFVT